MKEKGVLMKHILYNKLIRIIKHHLQIFKFPNLQIYFFISTSTHRTHQNIKKIAHQIIIVPIQFFLWDILPNSYNEFSCYRLV